MLHSCVIFSLILFSLIILFTLQLLDWQGVTSFHSKPTLHHPCCSEWVSVCCPGTAHSACSAHPAVGGFEVHSQLPWLVCFSTPRQPCTGCPSAWGSFLPQGSHVPAVLQSSTSVKPARVLSPCLAEQLYCSHARRTTFMLL